MKLCAISPLRIFFGMVLSPLSTSAKRPREFRRSTISAAYSFCYVVSSEWPKEFKSKKLTHIRSGHGNHDDLTGREPERPFPSKMFAKKLSRLPKMAR